MVAISPGNRPNVNESDRKGQKGTKQWQTYTRWTRFIGPLAVTVSVAAQLLGFKDTKSIYTLIRQGKIRARKSGRIFLISYKSLEDYVEGC